MLTSALLHGPAGRMVGSYLAGLDLDSRLVSGDGTGTRLALILTCRTRTNCGLLVQSPNVQTLKKETHFIMFMNKETGNDLTVPQSLSRG